MRSLAEAQGRPRRGPAGGLGDALQRPRRGPEEAQEAHRRPKEGLGDASQRPRRSPEAQGKPRKDQKEGPGEAWERLGTGPKEIPETFWSDPGKAHAGPRRGPGGPGADICLVPYQCLSSALLSALLSALPSALPHCLWRFVIARVFKQKTNLSFLIF